MTDKNYLDFTIKLANEVGDFIQKNNGKRFNTSHKDGNRHNLVTDIDKKSEALILKKIKKSFPSHGILSEEIGFLPPTKSKLAENKNDYTWVIDPIDGTTNFAHGYNFFAVSIALLKDGKPFIGVVYAPMLGELYSALKGKGAFLTECRPGLPLNKAVTKKIHVSKVKNIGDALLATGFSYRNSQVNMPFFVKLTNESQAIRRGGAASLDLVHTAAGRLDGYWEFNIQSWDIAAGALILTEAGGRLTLIDGAPLTHFKITDKNLCILSSTSQKFAQSAQSLA